MSTHTIYESWCNASVMREAERAELLALKGDSIALEERFGRGLEFGTAGLRGVVGMGLSRMNIFTVRQATTAFGRVILEDNPQAAELCLCFDCRLSSQELARETAAVLAGQGITVRMFLEPRPTPQLSFAIRHMGTAAGINITASHNPKDYNGYKAYWRTGAQLDSDLADRVAAHMSAIDPLDCAPKTTFAQACKDGLITFLGKDMDTAFKAACLGCVIDKSAIQSSMDMKIVYTPFHGVGGSILPDVLHDAGFRDVFCVPEQIEPDGTFPTLESPNPEEPEGFALAIAHAREQGADIIIGTDPDADRVAAVVRGEHGVWTPLTGNQMGGLLTHYIIEARKRMGTLPEKAALVQTIVSGGLSKAVAAASDIEVCETFTGFRFMAEAVEALASQGKTYLLAWEEAIGYMTGEHVRDKDGIAIGLLIAEMAAYYHARGKTLWAVLAELWRAHGAFAERTVSVPLPGAEGAAEMRKVMGCMRALPPKTISGTAVVRALDYRKGEALSLRTQERATLSMKGMNVLTYALADDSVFIVRPSGTEPKIKVYIHVKAESPASAAALADRYAAEAAETLRLWGHQEEYIGE